MSSRRFGRDDDYRDGFGIARRAIRLKRRLMFGLYGFAFSIQRGTYGEAGYSA